MTVSRGHSSNGWPFYINCSGIYLYLLMQILIQLLKFRFLQAHRLFKDAGYLLVLVVAVLALSMIARGIVFIINSDLIVSTIAVLTLLVLVHYQRKDRMFLESLFKSDKHIIGLYFSEYILLQIPLFILFIVTNQWSKVLVNILIALLVALVGKYLLGDYQIKDNKRSIRFIPLQLFEMKFFFERRPLVLIILTVLGLASYFHFAFFFVFVFLFSICLPGIFNSVEDRSMINWSKNFVAKKMISNMIAMQVFLLPALLLTCLGNGDHFFWYLGGYFITLLNICMFISYKYRTYTPDRILVASSNVLSIFILFNFLPGLFLVSLVYTGVNYIRAERNMNYYYA